MVDFGLIFLIFVSCVGIVALIWAHWYSRRLDRQEKLKIKALQEKWRKEQLAELNGQ